MASPIRVLFVLLAVLSACGRERRAPSVRPAAKAGPRVSMAALHATGGTPPGWTFTPPPGDPVAGHRTFVDLGCPVCHTVGDQAATSPGPELTGMGGHHPPEYFAEAILNPDAVIVDGPGYVGADGRSIMPSYPDMTMGELADVVAYLQSLGGPHPPMGRVTALPAFALAGGAAPGPLPPPPGDTRAYLTMNYNIRDGQLDAFAAWLRDKGFPGFLAFPGLERVDTWVDRTRMPSLTTMLVFRSQADRERFDRDPAMGRLGLEFDSFVGSHDHRWLDDGPPLFRAPSLSSPTS